jgi:tetratricopeptide (TPR) repeat protein
MSSVNRNLVLGLAVFLGLGLIIFFLPKAVVNTRQTAEKEPEKTESPVPDMSGNHAADSVSLVRIETLKKDLKSISGKKDRTRLLEQLGEAYLKSNRYDSAGAYFEKAALLSSDPELIFKSGNAYFEGMAFASQPSKLDFLARKTREVLEKVPSNDPLSVDAQAKIAMTWVNSETPMKGILKMRDLAEKNPENEFLSYQLGMLSFQSGQFDKAIARFEKAVAINPGNVNAWFYLAQSLQQTGKKKEALKAVDKGLSLAKEEDTKASFQELKSQLTQ